MLDTKWTDQVIARSTKYFKQLGINPNQSDILDYVTNAVERQTGAFQMNDRIARRLIKDWLKSKEVKI